MAFKVTYTDCCSVEAYGPLSEDGAVETFCDECAEQCCSKCAASFDQDAGYGEDGLGVRTHAVCKACARDYDRENDEAWDDIQASKHDPHYWD